MSNDKSINMPSKEADAMFRSGTIERSLENLRTIFGKYVTEENFHAAYALATDFYDLAKPMLDELADNYDKDFLYDVFLVFCFEKDKDRALALAVMLVDECKLSRDYEKIMAINAMLTDTFGSTRDNTPSVLILKAAISSAISIVEDITDELPSDELATEISKTLSFLPSCFYDVDFMLSSLNRIASCYTSESDPQLVTIAVFLPAIRQGFDILRNHFENHIGVGGLDGDSLAGIVDVVNEYSNILFAVEHPELTSGEPYKLPTDTSTMDNNLSMLREEQNVVNGLLNITDENRDELPGLKERYERLIDYFENYDISDAYYTQIELTAHIAYCVAAWSKVDIDFTIKAIEPYARQLLDFVPDGSTKVGVIYAIQTNLTYISEIYAYAKDAEREYECHVQFLKLGNVYLKRICFEYGIDYFLENTKQEYFFYHYVLASAAQIAQAHGYAVDELYFELCKRKNIFYLGEMWQNQGRNATEIHKLLKKDFSFDEFKAAIPADSMLIDFFYVRIFYMDEEFNEGLIESRKNSTCIAFSMTAERDIKIHFISDGVKLAENMQSDEYVPYFKWITKRLLEDAGGISRIIVCTEGDLNQLSFAALPHLGGFVTDKYSVRNIASVFDVVYPRAKKDVKTALVVSAPNFGKADEKDVKWDALFWSKKEGEFISDILTDEHEVATVHISGDDATAERITHNLAGQSHSIVHISTHGYFEDGKVYIVSAGANESKEATAISDDDFAEFSLENTALATYALCFGAKQSLILQDSLSGFIKASLLAGANTIIAPVAPIPDLATAIFMSEFYGLYLNDCKTENAEGTLQKTITAIREMSKEELLEKYDVEIKDDYPFADVRHWGKWVCFSAEEM